MGTDASLPADDMLEAWRVNNALCLELLEYCPDESFDLKPVKGKTIRSNFVHIVGVRRTWLDEAGSKRASEVPKLD